MKFSHIKYCCSSILALGILMGCSETPTLPTSKKVVTVPPVKKDTLALEKLEQEVKVPAKKESIQNVEVKKDVRKTPPPPIELTTVPYHRTKTEKKYWEWRKSKWYHRDSIGQRKSLFNKWKYAYPNMDSLEKEKKWENHWWNRYIKRIEKYNVIWEDSLRNLQNDPNFYKEKKFNPDIY